MPNYFVPYGNGGYRCQGHHPVTKKPMFFHVDSSHLVNAPKKCGDCGGLYIWCRNDRADYFPSIEWEPFDQNRVLVFHIYTTAHKLARRKLDKLRHLIQECPLCTSSDSEHTQELRHRKDGRPYLVQRCNAPRCNWSREVGHDQFNPACIHDFDPSILTVPVRPTKKKRLKPRNNRSRRRRNYATRPGTPPTPPAPVPAPTANLQDGGLAQ